jgi:Na+/H+ antiporter NhaA
LGSSTPRRFVSFILDRSLLLVAGTILALTCADVGVVGITAGIGFTVALFFATAAFPAGPALDAAKMGALLSFIAAPLAVGAARIAGSTRRARGRRRA